MEFDSKKIKKLLQTYRQSVMIVFFTVALSVSAEIYAFNVFELFGMEIRSYQSGRYILIFGLLLAFAAFLNKYLGRGEVEVIKSIKDKTKMDTDDIQKSIEGIEKGLRQEIDKIKREFRMEAGGTLKDEEREELIELLKESIYSSASNRILDEIKEKSERIVSTSTSERLKRNFSKIINRLSNEIIELGKRSKINLIIGSITALAGVSIFVMFVFERATESTAQSYLATEFAPRISLVIVIELFAYFFLGLYKNNLSEIKYFHNELTNIESRYLALEEAIGSADMDTVKNIVKEISSTERNFLLKKGESTVSIEEKRFAIEEQKGIVTSLLSSLNASKK